jgi:RimJ/RimL family protein N-acetyltransferase
MKVHPHYGNVYWDVPDGHAWEMLTVSYARRRPESGCRRHRVRDAAPAAAHLARRRPRAVRGNERRPGGDGVLSGLQSRATSDASVDLWQAQLETQGWSNWAAELADSGQFIGFVGLSVPHRKLPCSPSVEIGWRVARPFWGRGWRARPRAPRCTSASSGSG